MPLYEYECIKCRQNIEDSLKKLNEKINSEIVSSLVEKYENIYFIEVIDLNKKKILAKYGKRDKNGIDLNFYLDEGTKKVIFNARNYRFAELIFDKEEEKNLKCPKCGTEQIEKVVSSFAFTHDLSTDMPKPDLSGLPPEIRARTVIGDYIEEKDRPKKNR
jgi:DNA-directed RNA polymerase subunit RPC12/RpoP